MRHPTSLVKKPKDLLLGMIFFAIAASIIGIAMGYEVGSARNMGPGYLPIVLGMCLSVIALILVCGSFGGEVDPHEPFAIRPALLITAAALVFAVLIRPLGLPLAVFPLVVVAALAGGRRRLMPLLLLAAALSVGSTILFPIALGQQIPVLGDVFRR
jgi:hypothetical protein